MVRSFFKDGMDFLNHMPKKHYLSANPPTTHNLRWETVEFWKHKLPQVIKEIFFQDVPTRMTTASFKNIYYNFDNQYYLHIHVTEMGTRVLNLSCCNGIFGKKSPLRIPEFLSTNLPLIFGGKLERIGALHFYILDEK